MKKCKYCGYEIEEGSTFCPRCGAKTEGVPSEKMSLGTVFAENRTKKTTEPRKETEQHVRAERGTATGLRTTTDKQTQPSANNGEKNNKSTIILIACAFCIFALIVGIIVSNIVENRRMQQERERLANMYNTWDDLVPTATPTPIPWVTTVPYENGIATPTPEPINFLLPDVGYYVLYNGSSYYYLRTENIDVKNLPEEYEKLVGWYYYDLNSGWRYLTDGNDEIELGEDLYYEWDYYWAGRTLTDYKLEGKYMVDGSIVWNGVIFATDFEETDAYKKMKEYDISE